MNLTTNERRDMEIAYEQISPFELKNKLIDLAEGRKKITKAMLDAGRGNPNWIAATPREAFFALGQFAVSEARRVWNQHDLAGMPYHNGISERFQTYARENQQMPGMQLLEDKKEILHKRYASITQNPEEITFINRLVADSRTVALNHTAGLSTPQQVQMAIFSIFALLDKENRYKQLTREICHRRMKLLYEGLSLPQPDFPYGADNYTQFDFELWSCHQYGKEFTDFLKKNYEPIDILFRLAENSSIVLLNGGGFRAPTWSVRVSLANLDDQAYSRIGQELHNVLKEYVKEWEQSKVK